MKRLFYLLLFIIPFAGVSQVQEKIDRGVVALAVDESEVFISWRLLIDDPENVAFNIYRKDIGLGEYEKVNDKPISSSTNYLDKTVTPGHGYNYKVSKVVGSQEYEAPGEAYV